MGQFISFRDWLNSTESSAFTRSRMQAALGLGPDIPLASLNSRSTAPPWMLDKLKKKKKKKKKKKLEESKKVQTPNYAIDDLLRKAIDLKDLVDLFKDKKKENDEVEAKDKKKKESEKKVRKVDKEDKGDKELDKDKDKGKDKWSLKSFLPSNGSSSDLSEPTTPTSPSKQASRSTSTKKIRSEDG